MGGNNSYSKGWGGVPDGKRTHKDTGIMIDGYKVVVAKGNAKQRKNILNSNTKDATYLISSIGKNGNIQVQSVNVFDGHDLDYEINLEFDADGNIVPYDGKSKGSHAHYWQKNPQTGVLGRKQHDKGNTFAIADKYGGLVKKIELFNKKQK